MLKKKYKDFLKKIDEYSYIIMNSGSAFLALFVLMMLATLKYLLFG